MDELRQHKLEQDVERCFRCKGLTLVVNKRYYMKDYISYIPEFFAYNLAIGLLVLIYKTF